MAKGNPFKKGAATIRVPTSMDAPMDQEMADNWDYQGKLISPVWRVREILLGCMAGQHTS